MIVRFSPLGRLYYRRARPAEITVNASTSWHVEVRDGISKLTSAASGTANKNTQPTTAEAA